MDHWADLLHRYTRHSSDAQQAVKAGPKAALAKIMGYFKDAGIFANGWVFPKVLESTAPTLDRSTVTFYGLGANRPQDAIYPTSEVDAAGKPYSGANKYVMHFDRDQMPPAKGFWSLTMY